MNFDKRYILQIQHPVIQVTVFGEFVTLLELHDSLTWLWPSLYGSLAISIHFFLLPAPKAWGGVIHRSVGFITTFTMPGHSINKRNNDVNIPLFGEDAPKTRVSFAKL